MLTFNSPACWNIYVHERFVSNSIANMNESGTLSLTIVLFIYKSPDNGGGGGWWIGESWRWTLMWRVVHKSHVRLTIHDETAWNLQLLVMWPQPVSLHQCDEVRWGSASFPWHWLTSVITGSFWRYFLHRNVFLKYLRAKEERLTGYRCIFSTNDTVKSKRGWGVSEWTSEGESVHGVDRKLLTKAASPGQVNGAAAVIPLPELTPFQTPAADLLLRRTLKS